ncbi:MAG: cytochrome c3 family protein [Desulfobacterales bacterium]|nr:cytochrome c3 family protein [Desulfobacterales bacterium]
MKKGKKKRICFAAIFIIAILFITSSYVTSKVDCNSCLVKQRPLVSFSHSQHMNKLECLDCHHKYENGKNILEQQELEGASYDDTIVLNKPMVSSNKSGFACISCHNLKSNMCTMQAFHKQCMGCHDKMKNKGYKPNMCYECHNS